MAEISIIIPTLNEQLGIKDFLSQLQSLRPQCELIVVDGGSSDDTVQLATGNVDTIINTRQGRANQMNAGAAVACAPVLLFLHADTQLPIDAIEQIQLAMDNGYRWGRFNIKLIGDHAILSIVAWLMNKRSQWTGIATGDQAIFVMKDLFEQIGGFEDIALMEDISLAATLKKHSKPYCIESKVTSSARRWLTFGVFKTILLMWWLRVQFFAGADPDYLATLYQEGRFWKA